MTDDMVTRRRYRYSWWRPFC